MITGDFNAHFYENWVAQDNKASFQSDLSQMAGLSIMNWQPGVAGKWTWASGGQHSVLDYVLLSGGLVERIDRFVVDDEGFFDIGSDHNLMFWYIGTGKEETVSPKVKRKVRTEWRWRVGGNVNWEAYRVSIEDRMDRFAADMMSTPASGWTAEGRYKVFMSICLRQLTIRWGRSLLEGNVVRIEGGGMKKLKQPLNGGEKLVERIDIARN